MKQKNFPSFGLLPLVLATALYANLSEATVTYLGSGTLGNPDLSGLTGTLEDGTAENQISAGSGFAYTGYGNRFVGIPDRGPNASTYNAAVDNTTSYISRAEEIDITVVPNGSGGWTITPTLMATTLFQNATPLTGSATASNPNKTYFTGLSTGFDASNSSNSMRLDPESIRVSKSGNSFFVSDEYGPFVNEFDRSTGMRLRSFSIPAKFNIASPNAIGNNEITGNTSGRVSNKGMEGLAITPDGSTLYGIMQSPLLQDHALDSKGKKLGIYNRILKIDLASGTTQEFVYPLSDKSYTVSEMVAINDHEFLVDERDGNGGTSAVKKTFYKIDITGATDVSGVVSLPASGVISGVTTVTKSVSPFLDMLNPAFGLAGASFPEKIEGITFGPDLPDGRHTLVITNDNDFIPGNPNIFFVFAVDAADLNYVPQFVDHDGDGVADNADNCPFVANAGQTDTDGDGIGDACDPTPNGDTDGDGVDNLSDNCPAVSNADQKDTDGDGIGDVCDPTPNGDTDGDGVDNLSDNCPAVSNADQKDTDGDGMGDVCDTDADGDGMPNAWEIAHGLNPLDASDASGDPDGDGISNLQEYINGTDPNVSNITHVRNDFDGDGKSDVLFMNSSTESTKYWKGAAKAQSVYVGTYAAGYSYAGSGDFDGDGKADLLFVQASNNATLIWSGAVKTAASYPGTGAAGFDVAAICDVNGDGKDDVVWLNAKSGVTRIWSGASKASVIYPGTQNTAFSVAACADFDGDGKADIFWHNATTGANQAWLSGQKSSMMYPGVNTDLTWVAIGAGDVDGDAHSDMVWYVPSTGAIRVWLGGMKANSSYFGVNPTSFTPKAIGDYDGDGKADLLWGNDTSLATQIWPAFNKANVTYPGTYPAGFAVQK
jgi:hypothetical protein